MAKNLGAPSLLKRKKQKNERLLVKGPTGRLLKAGSPTNLGKLRLPCFCYHYLFSSLESVGRETGNLVRPGFYVSGGICRKSNTASHHLAVASKRSSVNAALMSCTPNGKPFALTPDGNPRLGIPLKLAGPLNEGSPVEFKPRCAGAGVEGVSSAS